MLSDNIYITNQQKDLRSCPARLESRIDSCHAGVTDISALLLRECPRLPAGTSGRALAFSEVLGLALRCKGVVLYSCQIDDHQFTVAVSMRRPRKVSTTQRLDG